jgi:hypothetical protein
VWVWVCVFSCPSRTMGHVQMLYIVCRPCLPSFLTQRLIKYYASKD